MTDLPDRKVGIIACSGEQLAEGTVTRLAALEVLHELRPDETVTICLPLFLAGGAEDRAFARVHPTITVDGCDLRCAARGTENYSNKPVAGVVVTELVAQHGVGKPEGCRRLNDAGKQAVQITAQRLAALVDETLGREGRSSGDGAAAPAAPETKGEQVACSCCSGVPVRRVVIDGQAVDLVALDPIFDKFRSAGRGPGEATLREVFDMVKLYNDVPPAAEASYREVVEREFIAACRS